MTGLSCVGDYSGERVGGATGCRTGDEERRLGSQMETRMQDATGPGEASQRGMLRK